MTRVLVVEDDAIIGSHIAETLARLGYDVPAIAENSDEALREIDARKPDVVLMDIRLRGTDDGVETVERLRLRSDVPVIYLTAHTDEATLARAKETGPYGYLVKPFNERDLRTSIEVAIRKRELERNQAQHERWFSTTLASLGEAVIAADAEGRITFMNPAAEAMTGFTAEAAAGRALGEVFKVVGGPGASEGSPANEGFAAALPPNVELVDREGKRHLLDDTASPIVDAGGAVLGRVIVFRDVTERKRLEHRLETSERLASLGTMASGLAHELNNPLAAVMGNVAFALEELGSMERVAGEGGAPGIDECRKALEDAASAAGRMRELVETMRWFVKRDAPAAAVLDVHELIEKALTLTEQFVARRVRLVRAYGSTPLVRLDEGQFVHVFAILLTTSAEAVPADETNRPELVLTTSTDDAGRAVVEVRRSGADARHASSPRGFEPSYASAAGVTGAGLGLALIQSLVLAAGGELTVERGVAGETFRVGLPPAQHRPAVAGPAAPPVAVRGRARVLVIDDEPSVGRVLQRLLSECDVAVETEGRAALARLANGESFDVIFCDLMMPELTGADVYSGLRSMNPGLTRRMVFLTGGAFSPAIEEFLRRVENRVIHKPFAATELRAAVLALASNRSGEHSDRA